MATKENIKVLLRIRPNSDLNANNYFSKYKELNSIIIPSESEQKMYNFDKVADENSTQMEIFNSCKNIFESFFLGYNCTVFAYGQTSSGKTFTMTGDKSVETIVNEPGLVPNGLKYIFDKINDLRDKNVKHLVKCSFVEIYNEQLFDLLDSKNKRVYLKVNLVQGVYVDQLTEKIIENTQDALNILNMGLSNRHVASTTMNFRSSRSHSVFSISLETCIKKGKVENIRKSVMHLVDLAGSERQKDSRADGIRLKEAGCINKSLHVLSQVISAHVDIANGKERYIRYRESKLTHLLKDSIGGNSKTVLIACIHPDIKYISETLSTLQFANNVKLIKNKVKVNINVIGDVESLQKEILDLRERLENIGLLSIVEIDENNVDSIWKRRFINAMGLRKNLSIEVQHLKEKLIYMKSSERILEEIIQNLKDEALLKDLKIQILQNQPFETVNEENVRSLVDSALTKIKSSVSLNFDHIKLVTYQSEVNSLRFELSRMKSMQSIEISESSLVLSLYREYSAIAESGEIDKQTNNFNLNEMKLLKIQEELTESNLQISQLQKEHSDLKFNYKCERQELESQIASLKSMLRDKDLEKERALDNRRKSLINYINRQTSPLQNTARINLDCRNTENEILPDIDEIRACKEPKVKKIEQIEIDNLTNNLKLVEAKNSDCQNKIGKLEYIIEEHIKDINELKVSLKDKEDLEINFNKLREKYNFLEIYLKEIKITESQLKHHLSEVLCEKDNITKHYREKVTKLQFELDNTLLEKNSLKDELEIVKNSLNLFKKEFLKNPELLIKQKKPVIYQDAFTEINILNSNDELFKLNRELLEANELINELRAIESENVDQIHDLEKRLIDKQNEIESLRESITHIVGSHKQKIEEIVSLHKNELEKLVIKCEKSELQNDNYITEIKKFKAANAALNKEIENQKSVQSEIGVGVQLATPNSFIKNDQFHRENDYLVEQLVTTSEQLAKDLQKEKRKVLDINKILNRIFQLSGISSSCLLFDNLKCLEAAIISYKKDIEEFRILVLNKNIEMSVKNDYISRLSECLTESNEHRKSIREFHGGLTNFFEETSQHLKATNSLNNGLNETRVELSKLRHQLIIMTMAINQCDQPLRDLIFSRIDENLHPN